MTGKSPTLSELMASVQQAAAAANMSSAIHVLDVRDPGLIAATGGANVEAFKHVQEVAFVLAIVDQSGSMKGFAQLVVDELNRLVSALQGSSGQERILFQLMLFNSQLGIRTPIEWAPIAQVQPLDFADYDPNSNWTTPLWDAVATGVGAAILKGEQFLAEGKEMKGVVWVFSDGRENASTQYQDPSSVMALVNELIAQELWVVLGTEFGPQAAGALTEMGIPLVVQTGKTEKEFRKVTDLVSSISQAVSQATVSTAALQDQAAAQAAAQGLASAPQDSGFFA